MHLRPYQFQSHVFNHRGLDLQVYKWTPATTNKMPIVFLHGWLDHAASWNTTAMHLNEFGHPCISLDHRGHGNSGHIAEYDDYHFIDYISDLQAVLSHLDLPAFHLVGHSMGGTIGSLYSAFCAPRPQSLILVDGLGPKHEEPIYSRHRLDLHLRQRSVMRPHRTMTWEIAAKKYSRAHPYLDDASVQLELHQITNPDPNHSGRFIWSWDPRHRNKSAIGFDLRRFLCFIQQVDIPTFSIIGKHSWYKQLPDIPERIKAFKHMQQQIEVPSGHSPHLECPETLAHAIHHCISSMRETNVTDT